MKKKFKEDELKELKDKLLKGWIKNVGKVEGFDETWQVVEDASRYSFNASHSLSVGLDSLYGAYLKSHYPLEYYTVAFNYYKDDIERTGKLTDEIKHFNIKIESPKFGYSKGEYFFDRDTNTIYKGIGCIKNLNSSVGDELFNISKNNLTDFVDILVALKETSINSRQLDILIKIGFFSKYGKSQKLLRQVELFNSIYPKKQFNKTKLPLEISEEIFRKYSKTETKSVFKDVDKIPLIKEITKMIPNVDLPIQTLLDAEISNIGYVQYKNKNLDKRYVLITEVNNKYTPTINTYSLGSGVTVKCKISKRIYENLNVGNIIYIHSMERKFGYKKVGETTDKKGNTKPLFEKDETKVEWWINKYSIINSMIDEVLADEE